jgi:hypothetical protein
MLPIDQVTILRHPTSFVPPDSASSHAFVDPRRVQRP